MRSEDETSAAIVLADRYAKAFQAASAPVDLDDTREPEAVVDAMVERHTVDPVEIVEWVDCTQLGSGTHQRPLDDEGPPLVPVDRWRFVFRFTGTPDLLVRFMPLQDDHERELRIEVLDGTHVAADVELSADDSGDLREVANAIRAAVQGWQRRIRQIVETGNARMASNVRATWLSRVNASRARAESLKDVQLSGFSSIEPDRSGLVDSVKGVGALPEALAETDTTGNWAVDVPTLDRLYDRACDLIERWAIAVRKHPKAVPAAEEHVRGNLLLMLNTHFQSAYGEAFNTAGKTDVLIEAAGKNVLVAECKWWDGDKSLQKALLQLFAYANSDNSRLAVLMFCAQKDVKGVRAKADAFLKGRKSLDEVDDTYPAVASLQVTSVGDFDPDQPRQDYEVVRDGLHARLRMFVVEFPYKLEKSDADD